MSSQSDCSHKNTVRDWNISPALTHHYSEELVNSVFLDFSFFCTVLNRKLSSVLHANKTFGCLITAKAMNNLVCPLLCSLNVNNKQTNPTRWSYYVQNVIWRLPKSLWDETEDPKGPNRRGEHKRRFPFAACCGRFDLEDHSISSHMGLFLFPSNVNQYKFLLSGWKRNEMCMWSIQSVCAEWGCSIKDWGQFQDSGA